MKLRDVAKTIGLEVGCSDFRCVWGESDARPLDNHGCQCRLGVQQVAHVFRVAQHLAAEAERVTAERDALLNPPPGTKSRTDLGTARAAMLWHRAEAARMRPVVEAAQRWRIGVGEGGYSVRLLSDAVDAYEKEGDRG